MPEKSPRRRPTQIAAYAGASLAAAALIYLAIRRWRRRIEEQANASAATPDVAPAEEEKPRVRPARESGGGTPVPRFPPTITRSPLPHPPQTSAGFDPANQIERDLSPSAVEAARARAAMWSRSVTVRLPSRASATPSAGFPRLRLRMPARHAPPPFFSRADVLPNLQVPKSAASAIAPLAADGTSFRTEEGLSPFRAQSERSSEGPSAGEPAISAEKSQRRKSVGADALRGGLPDCKYAAFVSHYKMEAAMEARFIKGELEETLKAPVFLDSDDLRNLNQLQACVLASQVLVLVQTAGVYKRPYVLLELCTAIANHIPIVAVQLCGGPFAYDFGVAADFLMHLDGRLSTSEAKVLRDHGVSLIDCAWKLSEIIPFVISTRLDPGFSKAVSGRRQCPTPHQLASLAPSPPCPRSPPPLPFHPSPSGRGAGAVGGHLGHRRLDAPCAAAARRGAAGDGRGVLPHLARAPQRTPHPLEPDPAIEHEIA